MRVSTEQIDSHQKFRGIIFCVPIFCTISLLFVGCGLTKAQKEGISSFGKAASGLGAVSSEQFLAFRNDTIRMNKTRLAMEGKKLSTVTSGDKPAGRDDFQRDLNFDSGLDSENIKNRVNAVDLLTTYGNLLVAFSKETHKEELKDASDKFVASVKSFPDNPLSKDEIKGLGNLVQIVGNIWIEWKKKKVVQEVVPQVSPLIQHICDNLERDFDIKKKGVAQNVNLIQDRLASASIDGLKRDPAGINDRLVQLEGFELATNCKIKLDIASDRVLKAVSAMRKADERLVQFINNEHISIDDIKLFYETVKDLADALKPFAQ